MPGVAAVSGFVKPAAGTLPRAVFPRPLTRRPQVSVNDFRVLRIEGERDRAGVLVFVENFLPRLAAVRRAKHAALFVRAVRMSESGDVDEIRIARIDEDRADLLCVAQSEMSPRLAAVSRFINAVAGGEIGPLESFATADVDCVRVRRCDCERADRTRWLIIKDRFPRVAVIVRLPNAAVVHSYIEDIRLAGNAGSADRPAGAEWADHSPFHCLREIAG